MQQLVDKGLVARPSDIYLLDADKLAKLEGFKEKSIHNLLQSIEKSRRCSLARFLMGLGIKYVGTETADMLAEEMRDLDHLFKATEEDFVNMEGIGEKTAHAIAEFFQNPMQREEIDLLIRNGVRPQKTLKKKRIEGHLFQGKTFVLTGALQHSTRDEAAALIKERGGKVTGAVSKSTDYLVVGEDPGSKYDKAKELKIEILNEEEFRKMLGNLE